MFTQALVDVFKENIRPTGFLRSFFTEKVQSTRYLSIEVQRGTEKVAVDVLRGTEGNRNNMSRSSQHIIDPPYYREYFDATELDVYDRMFGTDSIDAGVFAQFVQTVAEKLQMLTAKIERAYELQCATALQTGIITVADGTMIDYKRKADSLKDYTATPWTGAYDPYVQLATGASFLRTVGKSEGGVVNLIMGSAAATALINNATVKARGPLSNINFDTLRAPQRESVGGTTLGQITIGDYKANLWTYPEYYDNANGVSTPYIDPKKVIMLPEQPHFTMGYALVPQLVDTEYPRPVVGKYVYGDYRDQRKHAHEYDVRSAGVAILTAVDQVWTAQVVA